MQDFNETIATLQDFDRSLQKYADLALHVGINLKEQEGLIISVNEFGLPLARIISAKAYAMGAKHVELVFNDDPIVLGRYKNARESVFDHFPEWKSNTFVSMYEDHYHHLFLSAPDPELLKGIPGERIARDQRSVSASMEKAIHYRITGRTKWSILAVPSPAWAKMVFPDLAPQDAVSSLWEKIFAATRVFEEDPVAAWREHDERLKKYKDFLNGHSFEKLLFSAPGTELEVCLAEDHLWMGGSKESASGDRFVANIPTEEVFTTPFGRKVNGTVRSTKPLSLNGNIVEDFRFVFKDGKVVEFDAAKGKETLALLLGNDSGSSYLGEVALVPFHSPISDTGLLFNNTLFDENASVHFALGRAYPYAMKNGTDLAPEQLLRKGANHSLIHVDFMAGSPKMRITACAKNGSRVDLFEAGDWCF